MKLRHISVLIGLLLLFALLAGCKKDDRLSWIDDFNYEESQIKSFTNEVTPSPIVPVLINGKEVNIMFDTGNSQGLILTNAISANIDYETTGTSATYNADGTYRGDIQLIKLKGINIFGQDYSDVKSSISDWKMFGNVEFNGLLGLQYFQNKVVTLDYKNNKIAVSDKAIDYTKLNTNKYIIIPLIKSSLPGRSDLLYFQGEVNGEKSIIYLDTGYSTSRVALKGNNNSKDDNTAQVKVGNKHFKFKKLRGQEINRGEDFEYPVRLVIGSDILESNNFIITIDKIQNKLVLSQM